MLNQVRTGQMAIFGHVLSGQSLALCEIGEALKDPNNPLVDRMCSTNGQAPCPIGFVCTEQPDTPTGICCISKGEYGIKAAENIA